MRSRAVRRMVSMLKANRPSTMIVRKRLQTKDEIELADLPKAVVKTSDNGLSLAIKRIVKHGNIAVDKDHLSDHLARRSDIHNHKGEGQALQEDGFGQFKRLQIVAEGLPERPESPRATGPSSAPSYRGLFCSGQIAERLSRSCLTDKSVLSCFHTQFRLHLQTLSGVLVPFGHLKNFLIHLQGLVHAIIEIV